MIFRRHTIDKQIRKQNLKRYPIRIYGNARHPDGRPFGVPPSPPPPPKSQALPPRVPRVEE